MKVAVISIITRALGTVTKGLVQGLECLEIKARVQTIQTTALQDRLEYRGEFWILEETCCHSNSSEKPSANAGVKNSQNSKIIIIKTNYKEMIK